MALSQSLNIPWHPNNTWRQPQYCLVAPIEYSVVLSSKHDAPCIPPCMLPVCSLRSPYMTHACFFACSRHAPYILLACPIHALLHAPCMFLARALHASSMLHACALQPPDMLPANSLYAPCMHDACSRYARAGATEYWVAAECYKMFGLVPCNVWGGAKTYMGLCEQTLDNATKYWAGAKACLGWCHKMFVAGAKK